MEGFRQPLILAISQAGLVVRDTLLGHGAVVKRDGSRIEQKYSKRMQSSRETRKQDEVWERVGDETEDAVMRRTGPALITHYSWQPQASRGQH